MGAVGGMLGLAGGAGGTGFAGPAQANILNPATVAQANQTYKNAQVGVQDQQNFLRSLQGLNGVGNQASVYNQLQGIANGTGPNPAQAQLAQATGANVANQAALMAGQRGSNANAGMIARQAAQQGANTQQQAAQQAANLQANQSMSAIGQMGNMAGQQIANQQGALNSYNQAAQGEQGSILNAIAAQNNANVGMQSNVNQANASMANTRMGGQNSLLSSAIGGGASGASSGGMTALLGGAAGGKVPNYAYGSAVIAPSALPVANIDMTGVATQMDPNVYKGASAFGKYLFSQNQQSDASAKNGYAQSDQLLGAPGANPVTAPAPMDDSGYDRMGAAEGGKVPAMVSPGEKYLKPADVKKVERGANPMAVGETIPGKPKVGGAKNDYANDIVPKTLDAGGIVLPRSVTQSKHPHWAAHKFVSQILAKEGKLPKGKK